MNEIRLDDNLKTMRLQDFNLSDDNSDVFVMILDNKNELNDLKILGKSTKEWVFNSVKDYEFKVFDYNNNDDVVKFVKSQKINKKIVVVLFMNTPLITSSTLNAYLDYFKIKKLCTLRMPKGYIFDFEYLLSIEKIYNPQHFNFNEEDFLSLENLSSLSKIYNVLKKRILNFHINNGVIIYDENSVVIDAETNISSNVKIYPNNQILGECFIAGGTCIKANNTIENSIIKENCEIENSIIKDSLIEEESKVLDFSVVKNNVKIKKNTVLINKTVIGDK